jgi:hypothetical protein
MLGDMSVGFVEHDGRRVLAMSFAQLKDQRAILAAIAEARNFVAALPKKKETLSLVDVTRMRYSNDVLAAFRKLTKDNEPWEIATAVHGLTGIGAIAFRAVNLMTGSRMRGFETRDQALEWLLQQK